MSSAQIGKLMEIEKIQIKIYLQHKLPKRDGLTKIIFAQFHIDCRLIESNHFLFNVVGILVNWQSGATVKTQRFQGQLFAILFAQLKWSIWIVTEPEKYKRQCAQTVGGLFGGQKVQRNEGDQLTG